MAEEELTEESVADALTDDESGGKLGGVIRLGLPVVIILSAVAGGYFANRSIAGRPQPQQDQQQQDDWAPMESPSGDSGNEKYHYHDLAAITVNLNGPRLARYITAELTLVSLEEDAKPLEEMVEKQSSELKSWLIVYLSDCSLEEVRGSENLRRILREIQDSLNERLWPKGKPLIVRVDYKKWAIQ